MYGVAPLTVDEGWATHGIVLRFADLLHVQVLLHTSCIQANLISTLMLRHSADSMHTANLLLVYSDMFFQQRIDRTSAFRHCHCSERSERKAPL